MVILPLVPLVAIGRAYHWQSETPNGYWVPLATFLLVVNHESTCRSSFATALLQKQIDPRVLIHKIFAI